MSTVSLSVPTAFARSFRAVLPDFARCCHTRPAISPIQAELNHAAVKTKAEVARRFGVSRVRVVQYLNLLTLDPQILNFLDTNYGDPLVAATFTERRLRELLATTTPATQWNRFQEMLHEARSTPGIWNRVPVERPERHEDLYEFLGASVVPDLA